MEHLSNDQLRAVLARAKECRTRDWLMCLVAYWHGLRASEVVGITAASIEDGHLTVARLKGSLKTCQPLVRHTDPLFDEAPALIDWTREMHANQKLFPISRVQFYSLFRRYALEAGIPRRLAHPHILKHTIAMQAIQAKGVGIENVRQHLGHKSLSSTGAYLKVDDATASRAVISALRTGID
jgi:site-specific recombinase XerD